MHLRAPRLRRAQRDAAGGDGRPDGLATAGRAADDGAAGVQRGGRGGLGPEGERGAARREEQRWKGFARGRLGRRLEAARQLREAGNAAFADGKFAAALREYDFAVDLFRFEVANLARDQREAELGDTGRGLGSDDLPRIQAVRVPCLLNACACLLRLAKAGGGGVDADGGGAGGAIAVTEGVRVQLLRVLDLSDEVLKASPPAPTRAKAHYRRASAHVALANWREAWAELELARALQPASADVRELAKVVRPQLAALTQGRRQRAAGC